MNKYLFLISISCFLVFNNKIDAQVDTIRVSLKGIIRLAQSEAPDVQLAETKQSTNYWQYQSFQANYKPQMDFTSTLPNFNRTIEPITQPDGTVEFIPRTLMANEVGVSLSQDIALTGGNVFATTGFQRVDNFATSLNPKTTFYLTTPVVIGFNQPLFQFNNLKWDRKIEPLRYDEANKVFGEEMEEIAFNSTRLFFDVLISQLNVEAVAKNKADADTLFEISRGRFRVGRIAETELLQIELSAMNADADLAAAILNQQSNTERLRNFLGITKSISFDLIAPVDIPEIQINPDTALGYARRYRSETVAFMRRLKEAERDVVRAQSDNGLNIDVFGQFGLTQTSVTFKEAYVNPLDQERFRVGLTVPIADWGKAKAQIEIAKSNFQLEQMNVEQERISFDQEILLKVRQFDLQRNQVLLGLRAFEVSQKRLSITRQRYLIGKIEIVELNIAIREEDEARRSYIDSLRNYWIAHYELRRLTMYDFENGIPLIRIITN
jgi:outer membrane protein